jgi:hypothetical protein
MMVYSPQKTNSVKQSGAFRIASQRLFNLPVRTPEHGKSLKKLSL